MSTTYQLYPYLGDGETSIPSIDLTEQSMQYDLTVWNTPQNREDSGIVADFENLTANEVIDVAIRMLRIVLYQYPEKFTQIESEVDGLMPGHR